MLYGLQMNIVIDHPNKKLTKKRHICLIMSQRVSLLCILQLVFPGVSQWHMWHNVTTSVPFVYPHTGVPLVSPNVAHTLTSASFQHFCSTLAQYSCTSRLVFFHIVSWDHNICCVAVVVLSNHNIILTSVITVPRDCVSICLVNALSLNWEELTANSKLCLLCVFRE